MLAWAWKQILAKSVASPSRLQHEESVSRPPTRRPVRAFASIRTCPAGCLTALLSPRRKVRRGVLKVRQHARSLEDPKILEASTVTAARRAQCLFQRLCSTTSDAGVAPVSDILVSMREWCTACRQVWGRRDVAATQRSLLSLREADSSSRVLAAEPSSTRTVSHGSWHDRQARERTYTKLI